MSRSATAAVALLRFQRDVFSTTTQHTYFGGPGCEDYSLGTCTALKHIAAHPLGGAALVTSCAPQVTSILPH